MMRMRLVLVLFAVLQVAAEEVDTDGDGLSDREEKRLGTDPFVADSDGDGLSDYAEVKIHHTKPLVADTDGDGLSDGVEIDRYGTNPKQADTDGDGLSDGDEVGTSFFVMSSDPLSRDSDGDGLSDAEEKRLGTDPTSGDSDGDGVPDAEEVKGSSLPFCPAVPQPPSTKVDALFKTYEVLVQRVSIGFTVLVTLLAVLIWALPHPFVAAVPPKPTTANGVVWPPPPKYEFTAEEEVQFTQVSSLMTLIAILFTLHATLSAWTILGKIIKATGPPAEIVPDFFGDPLDGLQYAFFIRGAAQGFALIQRTTGDDIGHLMRAVASQKWLWKQMRVPIVIKSVKLVATIVPLLI